MSYKRGPWKAVRWCGRRQEAWTNPATDVVTRELAADGI